MDIAAFIKREKMLKLQEKLLAAEEERMTSKHGYTVEELDSLLRTTISEASDTE